MPDPTNILVTGGAGYIGSVLVPLLLAAGHRVRVFDRLLFGGESIRGLLSHQRFQFVNGDVRERNQVTDAMLGVDAVVHLAAIVGDPACRLAPDMAVAVNRFGAKNVLDAAVESGVTRFIFASTCSNYGKMAGPNSYVDEEAELRPVSLYAQLKVEFEQRLLSVATSELAPVVLRFATAFGISNRPRFDLVVNEFTRDLFERRRLEVFGETFWRPYCHIADISEAVRLVISADNDSVAGKAFNVGATKENYRKKDIVDLILRQLPDREQYVSFVKKDEDPRDYRVSFDKISSTLNFQPERSVSDGIAEISQALSSGVIAHSGDPRFRNDRAELYREPVDMARR